MFDFADTDLAIVIQQGRGTMNIGQTLKICLKARTKECCDPYCMEGTVIEVSSGTSED